MRVQTASARDDDFRSYPLVESGHGAVGQQMALFSLWSPRTGARPKHEHLRDRLGFGVKRPS
jgi:hypothetical protein